MIGISHDLVIYYTSRVPRVLVNKVTQGLDHQQQESYSEGDLEFRKIGLGLGTSEPWVRRIQRSLRDGRR